MRNLSALLVAAFFLCGNAAAASPVTTTTANGIDIPRPRASVQQGVDPNDELAEEDEVYWARFLQQDLPSIPTVEPSPEPTANTPVPTSNEYTEPVIGFASIDGYGLNGTTGGNVAGSKMVTVRDAEDFIYYIKRRDPYIVQVVGMLNTYNCSTCENRAAHVVRSDKTIIGVGPDSGIIGAGLKISGVKLADNETVPSNGTELSGNIIIRNMNFVDCIVDCIGIQMFAHHIVIDHNSFSGPLDGSIDIKRGSDLITVSWNVFRRPNNKTLLLGHDDENAEQDEGRLRVSYHHNWFYATHGRHPRVRFGHPVHVFNNYYFNISDYGIGSTMNAGLTIEVLWIFSVLSYIGCFGALC